MVWRSIIGAYLSEGKDLEFVIWYFSFEGFRIEQVHT
jgi:hypothetical protein